MRGLEDRDRPQQRSGLWGAGEFGTKPVRRRHYEPVGVSFDFACIALLCAPSGLAEIAAYDQRKVDRRYLVYWHHEQKFEFFAICGHGWRYDVFQVGEVSGPPREAGGWREKARGFRSL